MNTVNILCEFRQQISRRGYTVTQPAERRKCITVVVAVAVHTKMEFSFGCSAQIVVHLLFAFLFSFFFRSLNQCSPWMALCMRVQLLADVCALLWSDAICV